MLIPASAETIDVNVKKVGAPIQPTMYGMFFEDINYAADGGLYGELVKNRSFEFPQALMGWKAFGKVTVKDDGPFERCPHYVSLAYPGHNDRRTGIQNEGYFGIGLIKGDEYRFTVWAKAPTGHAQVRVQLIDEHSMGESQIITQEKLDVTTKEWKKYELMLKSPQTINNANLRIILAGKNGIDLEHVSLFPKETFKNRDNGLRRDLAQALADAHPGIFRFPGGCIVEGVDLETRYQWKNTIGPVENRPLNQNRWEYTFEHRYFPDYYQSYGLGFFEYFQLCEDIGAEPLPVLNVGMACQYQNWNNEAAHVPVDQLQPYIQDALDLIEFANGDESTVWGKKRAEMGHAKPFNMKFIAIGNEQWDDMYFKRLRPFVEAIRTAYPDIKIVGTSGPDSEGKMFEKGWDAMREIKADLVDEHFYRNEEWFLSHGLRYEAYDRKGPKVFAGEYACHGKGKKWNHFEASLLEAAMMTDYERNADVVYMTAYAPLFAHIDGWQWRPDLIWFDNTRMFKSCSYYVQQLYMTNKGTNMIPCTMDKKPVAGEAGLYASAVIDKQKKEYIVKVVNVTDQTKDVTLNLKGIKGDGVVTTLTLNSTNLDADNTLDAPEKIHPIEGVATVADAAITDKLPAKTFRVYKVKY
ncbi:MAG: alpha-L-arabinofuranosidase C-terminal domain-containing protein [Prevotellaceae bacterium]|nr:alpha-L-arabinofuranosidase C-terminal domain-containing protein [Prevotellaceae bacterium]